MTRRQPIGIFNSNNPKRPKYGNRKTGKYDSKKESDRANDLKALQWKGEISNLKEQVKFELIPAQYRVINGKKVCVERACYYYADFTYNDKNKEFVVEDCKGCRTDVYKLKKKLMLQVHGITIKET